MCSAARGLFQTRSRPFSKASRTGRRCRANTPPHIRSLLKRCLEKDPRHRLRDIGDAGLLLGDTSGSSEAAGPQPRAALPPAPSRWTRWAAVAGWIVAAVLAIVNAAWIAGGFSLRATVACGAAAARTAARLTADGRERELRVRSFAISSDGTRIVYVGSRQHRVVPLSAGSRQRERQTVGRNGRRVCAGVLTRRARRRFPVRLDHQGLPLDGGLPRDVARADAVQHWAWSGPDHIVVAGPAGLLRVPVNGGSPELLAKLASRRGPLQQRVRAARRSLPGLGARDVEH